MSYLTEYFYDYALVRNHIICRLLNYRENETALQEVPHVRYLDLAVLFYIRLEQPDGKTALLLISVRQMEAWKKQPADLLESAAANTERLYPYEFVSMSEVLGFLNDEASPTEGDIMYVLTNRGKNFGAACILYPDCLKQIADGLKDSFYILPSSVHEVLIVPRHKAIGQPELNAMIREINETQLAADEVLADHAYFYDRTTDSILY